MNIFIKFEHLKDATDSEQKIIDYIKTDPQNFIKKSANEISKECYVSSSSIYRFCDKVGFKKRERGRRICFFPAFRFYITFCRR